MTTPGSCASYPSDVINIGNGTAQKKEYRSIKERGSSFYTFREGGCKKRRPWSNLLTIEYLVVSYAPLVSRSRFKPFSSVFEGGGGTLRFLHLGVRL